MILILFSRNSNGVGERLLKIIHREFNEPLIEIAQTVETFLAQFHHPHMESLIAVIIVDKGRMLRKLISRRDFMDDVPIVLVLPDGEEGIVSMGLRLYPRFITYQDGDFSDLIRVLKKLRHRILKEKSVEMNEKMKQRAVPSYSQESG